MPSAKLSAFPRRMRPGTASRCGTPLKVWNDPRLEHFTLPEENAENITMADAAGRIPWTYNAEKSRFESGNRGKNNTVSETSLTFTLPYGGTLRFDWGVSSESGYDKATTALGGTKIADAVSGEKTGSFDTTLAAGTYTLTLSYAKDSASSDGEDLAYVRTLTLTGRSPRANMTTSPPQKRSTKKSPPSAARSRSRARTPSAPPA